MIEILYIFIFLLVVHLLGVKALHIIKLELSLYEKIVLSFGLGFIVSIVIIFIIGIAGLLYKWVFIVIAILVLMSSLGYLRVTLQNFNKFVNTLRNSKPKADFDFICVILLISFFIANFLVALSPLTEWDSLVYHMAFPKIYLKAHSIVDIPSMSYSYFPQGIESIYMIGELFSKGGRLSSLIAYSFGLLATLTIVLISQNFFSKSSAILSGLIFYTLPAIIERASQTMIDIPLTFFVLLAYFSFLKIANLMQYSKDTFLKWLVLFSMFLGILITIKITSLLIISSFIIAVIYLFIFSYKLALKENLRYILLIILVCLIFASMWSGRSLYYKKDPAYPLFTLIFGGGELEKRFAEVTNEQIREFTQKDKRGIIDLIVSPLTMTFYPSAFDNLMGITPFYIIYLPLLLYASIPRAIKRIITHSLIICLPYYIIWYFTNPTLRYIFPILAIITPLCGYSASFFLTNWKFRKAIMITFLILFGYSILIWGGINLQKIPVIIGLVEPDEYFSNLRDENPHNIMNIINTNLPKGSKILLFNEARAYYLDVDYVHGSPILQNAIDYKGMKDYKALYNKLKEIRITHILFKKEFNNSLTGYDAHTTSLMSDLLEHNAVEQLSDEHFKVYILI